MAKSVDTTIWDVDLVAEIRGQRYVWAVHAILPGHLRDVCNKLARKLTDAMHVLGLKALPKHHYERHEHGSSAGWHLFDPFGPVEDPVTQTHPCA